MSMIMMWQLLVQIAAALEAAVRPERLEKLLGAIGLLSTGWGTLLLGLLAGVVTLSPQSPFFPTFARLSVAKRERILQGWSQSSLQPLQAMFKVFKSVTGWAFYSKVCITNTYIPDGTPNFTCLQNSAASS